MDLCLHRRSFVLGSAAATIFVPVSSRAQENYPYDRGRRTDDGYFLSVFRRPSRVA